MILFGLFMMFCALAMLRKYAQWRHRLAVKSQNVWFQEVIRREIVLLETAPATIRDSDWTYSPDWDAR